MAQKERSLMYFTGGIVTGSAGGTIADILFGSASINCPSAASLATVVAASVAVTNVADGDNLFIQEHYGAPSGMILFGACAISGGISASWYNSASAAQSASADVTVSYLVFK